MIHRLLPLAAAIGLVVGCTQKPQEVAEVKVDGDPNATYELKYRGLQQGDRVEVTVAETTTRDAKSGGKAEKVTQQKRYEYAAQVTEMPAGAKQPTKQARNYKVAQATDFKTGQMKSLSFEGKTVSIAEKQFGHELTVGGQRLTDFLETMDIEGELRTPDKQKIDALLPGKAVKVGESWAVGPESLKSFLGGGLDPAFDARKSKLECTLTRAYTRDGKQWGIIAFNFDIAVDVEPASQGKDTGSGTVKFEGSVDAVLDGSAPDAILTGALKASFSGIEEGQSVNLVVDGTLEKSIKGVK